MKVIHRSEDTKKLLELSVDDDKLKLFIRIEPRPEHAAILDDELFKEIVTVCPADLVDADVLKDITVQLRRGTGCDERRVGKGVAAINGRDGKVVWLVRRHTLVVDQSSKEYLPDLFHLGLFENVKRGQSIARIYPPAQGRDGRDVLGGRLPGRSGKPLQAKLDKTTRLVRATGAERFDVVVTEVNGYASEEAGRISVKDVLDIAGDVDYGVGHIDFIGSVRIRGDVKKGFNVRAKGAIEIFGSVVGDNLIASDSSVTIRGYHNGGEKGTLFSLGDYSVSVAEGVRPEVRGHITIEREARECSFRCSTLVFAPKASVVGGSLWCVRGAEVRFLGNDAGVTTKIELHNSLEVTHEFQSLREAIATHVKAKATLELHLGAYALDRRRISLLHEEYRNKVVHLVQKYDQICASLITLEAQSKNMREAGQVEIDAAINIHEKIYAGAVLVVRNVELTLSQEVTGPVSYALAADGSEWRTVEFKSLEGGKV